MLRALKKYFAKRKERIDALLTKRKYTAEDYHKIRVEIKKMDALFELLNFSCDNFKRKKYFKLLNTIFKQAGVIRELQLETNMLKKNLHNQVSSYLSNLKQCERSAQRNLFSIPDNKFKKKLKENYKSVVPFVKKMNKKIVNEFLEKKKRKIHSLLNENLLRPDQVHEIRKRLKSFYYNLESVDLQMQYSRIKQTYEFQEILGKWHDYRVMSGHLKKAINSGQYKSIELKRLEKIKAKLTSEAEIWFAKINAAKQSKAILPYDVKL